MLVHWHRSDLRAPDNEGLRRAAERADGVVPLFVFDEEVLSYGSPPRVAFMLDALRSLRSWYRERGGDLYLAAGDPSAVLPDLCERLGAEGVVWNRGYSGLARERDEAVRAALDDAGIDHRDHGDALHHEPGSITTNEGEHYSVFTYFWRKWRDREKADPHDPPPAGALEDAGPGEFDAVPDLAALGFDAPEATVEPGGREAGRERLESFCAGDIYDYEDRRDYPADGCTSRLSAHLKWGTVGVREVYAATEEAMAASDGDSDRESVEEFRSQLAWREFYAHVLRFNPEFVAENFDEYERPIEWREDDEELRAWKAGETGYPIVDAGMRQLRAEAYVHNRVRMIVASFLTKDLLLDWREGYAHFRRHLADHDAASDAGGWQWAASTGTDAQPYFRIFNPMRQGEEYDPEAAYIREHVPELAGVDPETIHSWHELDPAARTEAAPEYPAPIVDHGERRERALATFERARGEGEGASGDG
ncbi:deoxyribodipyrimidine photo-lyase [Halobacteriales archaeon QS_5_70_17]|nr:MAG: deoxyribodipyrimidine photo-lyase [Halobacteriales archaeon QS_5_70_17]